MLPRNNARDAATDEPQWVFSLHHTGLSGLDHPEVYPPEQCAFAPTCIHAAFDRWTSDTSQIARNAGGTEWFRFPKTTGASELGPQFGAALTTDLTYRTGKTLKPIRLIEADPESKLKRIDAHGRESSYTVIEHCLGGRGSQFSIQMIEVFGRVRDQRSDAPTFERQALISSGSGGGGGGGNGSAGGAGGAGSGGAASGCGIS